MGWLLRVATNLALNARRRRDTRVGVPIRLSEEHSPAASDPALHSAKRDAVHQTLLLPPENMRAALVLREIYRSWGQRVPAVRQRGNGALPKGTLGLCAIGALFARAMSPCVVGARPRAPCAISHVVGAVPGLIRPGGPPPSRS